MPNLAIPVNQLINRIGKYMYKHIDGAYETIKSSNSYDVYVTVYYQLALEDQDPNRQAEDYNDLHEMNINISLTTYQNKIRVNIHEVTPNHWTFGYILFPPESLEDPEYATKLIYSKVIKKIKNHYKDYLFLF